MCPTSIPSLFHKLTIYVSSSSLLVTQLRRCCWEKEAIILSADQQERGTVQGVVEVIVVVAHDVFVIVEQRAIVQQSQIHQFDGFWDAN